MNTKLITINNIKELVSNYNLALDNLYLMNKHFEKTNQILENTLGKYTKLNISIKLDKKDIEKEINIKFWRLICNKTIFKISLTEKLEKNIKEDLKNGKLPKFTEDNINNFLSTTVNKSNLYFKDFLLEIYNLLRSSIWTKLKTNKKNWQGITQKIILESYIDDVQYFDFLQLKYYYESNINKINNCFRHLDKKGKTEYQDNLATVIQINLKQHIVNFETDYFKIKCFKSGNIHLFIKNQDLVNKFNIECGKNFINQ